MWVKSVLNWGKEWVNFALFHLCRVKTGVIVKSVCGKVGAEPTGVY